MNISRDLEECFEVWIKKTHPNASLIMKEFARNAWCEGWYGGKEDSMNYTIVTSAITKLTDEERASLDQDD